MTPDARRWAALRRWLRKEREASIALARQPRLTKGSQRAYIEQATTAQLVLDEMTRLSRARGPQRRTRR